ncbi:RING-H2 finger protein ATL2 [Trifolium repens]|nr:RING-H2 finger protein ATL2 [Trifolium repens]
MGATAISGTSDTLGESNAIELTGKIMVVAIIFLFMVVIFVLMLHLYAKWFWWRFEERTVPQPPNRRRRRRRFVFAPGQDPVVYGTHQIGLEVSILKSLPVLVFKPEDFKDGLECAVCLCDIVEGEKTRLLPKCNHGFHLDCIDMWFQSHSTCPLCRNLVSVESSNGEEINVLVSSESDENLSPMNDLESSNFPTNVLVWGNHQTQVNSSSVCLDEGSSQQQSYSTSSSSFLDDENVGNSRCNNGNGMLVIDIPLQNEFSSSSLSSCDSRCVEDEMKSPMSTRLRSFKRLLSREKKLSPSSPNSMDVEQGSS